MKTIIKLTTATNQPILIGVESIIEAKAIFHHSFNKVVTEIRSVGAMVTTNYVNETITEIHNLINN